MPEEILFYAVQDCCIPEEYIESRRVKKILEPLIVPPNKDDDPDFYLDYGSDTSYHTKTGKGECAA